MVKARQFSKLLLCEKSRLLSQKKKGLLRLILKVVSAELKYNNNYLEISLKDSLKFLMTRSICSLVMVSGGANLITVSFVCLQMTPFSNIL